MCNLLSLVFPVLNGLLSFNVMSLLIPRKLKNIGWNLKNITEFLSSMDGCSSVVWPNHRYFPCEAGQSRSIYHNRSYGLKHSAFVSLYYLILYNWWLTVLNLTTIHLGTAEPMIIFSLGCNNSTAFTSCVASVLDL